MDNATAADGAVDILLTYLVYRDGEPITADMVTYLYDNNGQETVDATWAESVVLAVKANPHYEGVRKYAEMGDPHPDGVRRYIGRTNRHPTSKQFWERVSAEGNQPKKTAHRIMCEVYGEDVVDALLAIEYYDDPVEFLLGY